MVDASSYVEAVEFARWPFVSTQEPYIAALISLGRVADAARAAEKGEREYMVAVASRGAVLRESDLLFVRKVQTLMH